MNVSCDWNCVTGRFMMKFSPALSNTTTFHI
jgi:hypothetical protein